jgi:hypothetical protein
MRILTDAYSDEGRLIIGKMLSKHGCAAEHHYSCYINNITDEDPNSTPYIYYLEEENDIGILAIYEPKKNNFRIFTELLAPKERKASLMKEFLDHVYSLDNTPTKVWAELETDTRQNVLSILKNSQYKCNTPAYTLIWPVFDMSAWNGDLMQGGEWKDMRYYWNKFFREHKVEFVTADKVSKEDMIKLVYAWKKSRKTGDRAYIDYYLQTINDGFKGYDVTRIMLVDGVIGAITAGFIVRKGYYYSSIGLYNTEIPRCNDIANMDDLINLKKLGIEVVDFGGIELEHLDFKKKFRPTRYYETHMFSIVLKDAKISKNERSEVQVVAELK